MSSIEVELYMPKAQLDEESFDISSTRALDSKDFESPITEVLFVEPVSVLILVGAATLLAERIVRHWLRSREQGVEIDMRRQPPRISRLAGTPYGFLVAQLQR